MSGGFLYQSTCTSDCTSIYLVVVLNSAHLRTPTAHFVFTFGFLVGEIPLGPISPTLSLPKGPGAFSSHVGWNPS